MSRWVALLLAVVGGAAGAWAATLTLAGAIGGVLWIFVFGDDPWPEWVNPVFGILVFAAGAAMWVALAWTIWSKLRPRA